ncbi:MAG: hypothetical protein IM556_03575, partial [Pseudanabaena sp. M110S1SP2A07QC]|nr:hypothetical protein [Pseudanabaena sp. M110S1SP2A07QC]
NANRGRDAAFNDFAYNFRIAALVAEAEAKYTGSILIASPSSPRTEKDIATVDPTSVKQDIAKRINEEGLSSEPDYKEARKKSLDSYFRLRTRKVPYREVPFGAPNSVIFGGATAPFIPDAAPSGLDIGGTFKTGSVITDWQPPLSWMIPSYINPSPLTSTIPLNLYAGRGLITGTGTNTAATFPLIGIAKIGDLQLSAQSDRAALPAAKPETAKVDLEKFLGDRVLVGNNIPALWLKQEGSLNRYAGSTDPYYWTIPLNNSIRWNDTSETNALAASATNVRYRYSQATSLKSLGVSDRGGFWELNAADNPAKILASDADNAKPTQTPVTGGVRVVTGAGVYSRIPAQTFLPQPPALIDSPITPNVTGSVEDDPRYILNESQFPVVWSDAMPMTGAVAWDGTKYRPYLFTEDINRNGMLDAGEDTNTNGLLDTNRLAVDADGATVVVDALGNTAPNPDNRKGDLQMRASAVYHYKSSAFETTTPGTYQTPIACVSSYYDPTSFETSRNNSITTPSGRSNNGFSYDVGATAASITAASLTYDTTASPTLKFVSAGGENPASTGNEALRLAYQANLMFPNGRFVNEPLRNALIKIKSGQLLTLPEQSAIDSTLCAFKILENPTATNSVIPFGAIKESSFLDGRQVKALNRDESLRSQIVTNSNRSDLYNLEIEQRQPLEIRTTDLNMDLFRSTQIDGTNNDNNGTVLGLDKDFLLPYSGIVYATRDDAAPDLSYFDTDASGNPIATSMSRRRSLSPTDFRLDPSRRPNAIRLTDGLRLWRTTNVLTNYTQPDYSYDTRGEKGLVLISNDPVYIKAQKDPNDPNNVDRSGFNLHSVEEFVTPLDDTWSNFYSRANLDSSFSYRKKQRKDPVTQVDIAGDEWRPATVIADAISVQSADFQDGFRNRGDYDLRNNRNTSMTTAWLSRDTTIKGASQTIGGSSLAASDWANYQNLPVVKRLNSGFLNNNFVTGYTWLPNAAATLATNPSNLWPGLTLAATTPSTANTNSYFSNGVTPVQRRLSFGEYSMEICRKIPTSECNFNDWIKDAAGTTALPSRGGTAAPTPVTAPRYIAPEDERFPRRLAFLRYDDIYKDGNKALVLVTGACPSRDNVWPMPIGVTNGNNSVTAVSSPGFTYPQAMGARNTPFNGEISIGRNNAYGNVPCPPLPKPLIRIEGDVGVQEGRRMYFFPQTTAGASNANPTNPPLRADDVPVKPAADPSIEIVSNTNAPIAAGGNLLNPSFAITPTTNPATWQNHGNRNITNSDNTLTRTTFPTDLNLDNNAVYRRITFRVRVDNPSGAKNLATIASNPITVNIAALEPPFPYTTSIPLGYHAAKSGLAGSQPQVRNTRGATNTANGFDTIGTEEQLSQPRGLSVSGGVDYISTVFMNVNALTDPTGWMPADTVGTTQVLRFPDSRNNNCLPANFNISMTSCFQDVSILVVRDSADEENEVFRLRIENPNTGVTDAALSQGPTPPSSNASVADYRWGIINNDDGPPGGAGATGVTGAPTPTPT